MDPRKPLTWGWVKALILAALALLCAGATGAWRAAAILDEKADESRHDDDVRELRVQMRGLATATSANATAIAVHSSRLEELPDIRRDTQALRAQMAVVAAGLAADDKVTRRAMQRAAQQHPLAEMDGL